MMEFMELIGIIGVASVGLLGFSAYVINALFGINKEDIIID